jgi:drug/metabolite transporter (DMT)-like permease
MHNRKALLVFIALCIIWGSTWYFIKIGLAYFSPFRFAGVRFLIAGSMMCAAMLLFGKKLPKDWPTWKFLIVSGFLSITFPYAGVFWGEQYISSGLAAVLNSSIPLFVALLAHLTMANERLTANRIIGLIVGFTGIVIIFKNDLSASQAAILGGLSLTASSFSAAGANVYMKIRGASWDPMTTVAVHLSCAGVILTTLSLFVEPHALWIWSVKSIVALLFLSIFGSVLAFLGFYWLIRQIAITKAAMISFITPVVAVIIGAITLNERIGFHTIIGIAGIMFGLYFVSRKNNEKPG